MLDVRQALGRGVAYFEAQLESDESKPLGDATDSAITYVRTVMEDLAGRGVPGADEVAQELAQRGSPDGSEHEFASLATRELGSVVRDLPRRQQPDGSWIAQNAAASSDPLLLTASCLQALAATMPAIFENPEHDRVFWREGYVILDFLDEEDVEALSQAHLRIEGTSVDGFYSTWFRSLEVRADTDRSVRSVIATKLKERFPEYRMVFGTFMSKGCEGETTFPMHQDPSLIDEKNWTPLTFWIPLVDVDENNGCIYAVPGSHLLSSQPRPSFAQFGYPDQATILHEKHTTPVAMRAGQMLVFHSGMIHTSPPNRTQSLRIAAAGVMVPDKAELQFCRINESQEVLETFAVEDSFYLRMRADDSFDDLRRLGEYPATRPPLDLSRLPQTSDPLPPPITTDGATTAPAVADGMS